MVASLTARGLVRDLHESTDRISTIVGAVKEYTYMGRAQAQRGRHPPRPRDHADHPGPQAQEGPTCAVERDYDPDLPTITAHGSQLNQVWTNLLDNALDALDGDGIIGMRTRRAGDERDRGGGRRRAGHPRGAPLRLFDPSSPPRTSGRGTGLGLDIVNRIVENHRGQVRVLSNPPDTRFQVRLPIG